jgi:hypothetical protein
MFHIRQEVAMRVAGCAAVVLVLGVAIAVFAPAVVASDDGDQVVITRPGVVFHKAGASDVRGRSVVKSVDAALEAGYTPCRICFGRELGGNVLGSMNQAAGGAAIGLDDATSTIPAPPSSTVTQPFGVKFRSTTDTGKRGVEASRDPYDLPETRKFATVSGAYEER